MELTKNQIIDDNTDELTLYMWKSIPKGIVFNISGPVLLNSLLHIPNNIVFNNTGLVDLYALSEIPTGVVFNNFGYIVLNKTINLSKLTFKELMNIYERLPINTEALNKDDILHLLREKKLNLIL